MLYDFFCAGCDEGPRVSVSCAINSRLETVIITSLNVFGRLCLEVEVGCCIVPPEYRAKELCLLIVLFSVHEAAFAGG